MNVAKGLVFTLVLGTTVSLCMTNTASAQEVKRGAVVGGLSGAAIGAIIGDHNHEAGAGAAIGGAIGAIAGGMLGSANQQQYGYQPRTSYPQVHTYPQPYVQSGVYRQPPHVYQQPPVQVQRTVTNADVVAMTQSRVSDSVIISEIQNKGLNTVLDVQDIVYLSQQGVSDAVIRTMQRAGTQPVQPVVVARPTPPRTIIVDRYPTPLHVYQYPSHRRPTYQHHHTARRRPRSGVSISVGSRF